MGNYTVMSRDAVVRVARIIGPHSAASMALVDADRRIAAGEPNIGFLTRDNAIFVGPVPPELTA